MVTRIKSRPEDKKTLSEYTHTRISKVYLKKLAKLAKENKRNTTQQLHHLIDEAKK